jgi:hypothetical protein
MKLGRKTQQRCRWCHTWNVYECGNPHSGLLGVRLTCRQCNNRNRVCNDSKHPSGKPRWDV